MSAGIIAGNCFSVSIIAQTITAASVSANTTSEQDFTVPGLIVGDAVLVNPPGLTTGVVLTGARVKAANTLSLQYQNTTAGGVVPLTGTHTITVFRLDGASPASRVLT